MRSLARSRLARLTPAANRRPIFLMSSPGCPFDLINPLLYHVSQLRVYEVRIDPSIFDSANDLRVSSGIQDPQEINASSTRA